METDGLLAIGLLELQLCSIPAHVEEVVEGHVHDLSSSVTVTRGAERWHLLPVRPNVGRSSGEFRHGERQESFRG